MSVEVWDPAGPATGRPIDPGLLEKFLNAARGAEAVSGELLKGAGLDSEAWVMTQDESAWQSAEKLPADDLVSLVRFFTLVEAGVPGWEAGNRSPVIALVRFLRAREAFTPELRRWVKSNTDNRYLPYGSAL